MKDVAALILTRNLPELADELAEWINTRYQDICDVIVLENGSDPDKQSRYADIVLAESRGPAGGVNVALQTALERGYKYLWLNYNDARYEGEDFLRQAVAYMDQYQEIGMFFPWWEGNMWPHRTLDGRVDIIAFSDILSFVIRREALEVTAGFTGLPSVRLQPFWDNSNYTAHFNLLATSLALSTNGLWMVADRNCHVYEKATVANQASEVARGFSDDVWKKELGPHYAQEWLGRAFPRIKGEPKIVRNVVIEKIRKIIDNGVER